jgi:kumamolisin
MRFKFAAVLTVMALLAVGDYPGGLVPQDVITGPYARLLRTAADLGPSRRDSVRITVELHGSAKPLALLNWADAHGLSVQWEDGEDWASIEGSARRMAEAFDVPVHDYRRSTGEQFYASTRQPRVPVDAAGEVAGLGRILSYTPYQERKRPILPRDVPDQGLLPTSLLTTYNADSLAAGGFTGKGATVVVFAFDGFAQQDMDHFADWFNLPKFTPEVMGDMPRQSRGEATMDLQMIHAVAPDARTVLVNSRPTVEGDADPYVKLGQLMREVDRSYPGAIWSLSIGWGCDRLLQAANLAPVRAAMRTAQSHGTTIFDAAGDLAGLECKGGHNWSDPPSPDDVGLDAVASLPEVTSVGGTTLSTDGDGRWLSEQAWYDIPLTQGSGGGASTLFNRPAWQSGLLGSGPRARRLTPDVSAVADPFTGVKFVHGGQVLVGGGTSQAAPIWAGFAAVINQFLAASRVGPVGDLNPLLYEIAEGAGVPGFHLIDLGANAVDSSHLGYDMVTGLGTPNVANLAKDILVLKAAGR